MKKILYISFIAGALLPLFIACNDDENSALPPAESIANPVTAISVTNATSDGIVLSDAGATLALQIVSTPANADNAGNYVFTSDNRKIFTVSTDGVLTATGAGTATLTVISKNDAAVKAQYKVTVVGIRVTSIDIADDYKTRTLLRTNAAGPSYSLGQNLTVEPANASVKELKYSSSAPEIATVDEYGTVTALWEGTAVIRAEATDGSGVFAQSTVTVSITKITSLSFYTNTFNALNINSKMNQSGNYDLSPADYAKGTGTTSPIRYQPANATRNILEYTSSDPEVLAVESTSSNGFRLIPKKAGRATITATATDGSDVSVTSNPVNVYGIYPHTSWQIAGASPTGEAQDGNDVWGGLIANFLEDGKQVGFYRKGTPENPTDDPYFVLDFGSGIPFNYLIYSHSWSGNWNNYSRANRQTLYGSNDGTNFDPIGSQLTLNPAYNAFYVFPQVYNYRYLKVVLATSSAAYSGTGGTYSWGQAKLFIVYDFNVGYLAP
ncbi:MAG: Ig-like domain-containing protein [Prevotellaceae bacterium]|jgi:uncharacterized protein YjdB|nr:Ig-like domain-containing protein [Prevotellaceae bacterium]